MIILGIIFLNQSQQNKKISWEKKINEIQEQREKELKVQDELLDGFYKYISFVKKYDDGFRLHRNIFLQEYSNPNINNALLQNSLNKLISEKIINTDLLTVDGYFGSKTLNALTKVLSLYSSQRIPGVFKDINPDTGKTFTTREVLNLPVSVEVWYTLVEEERELMVGEHRHHLLTVSLIDSYSELRLRQRSFLLDLISWFRFPQEKNQQTGSSVEF